VSREAFTGCWHSGFETLGRGLVGRAAVVRLFVFLVVVRARRVLVLVVLLGEVRTMGVLVGAFVEEVAAAVADAAVVAEAVEGVVLPPKNSPVSACTAIASVDSAGNSLVPTFEPSAS
jgi:hypothetical protein